MVVKGQSGLQKKPASATSEQVRLAQLTLEGKSTEDDTASIQKLIKKVIETTRCSPAQAELALYDNDNNLVAAVDWIFEQGMQVESWTEHKSKKDKKKEEEEKRVISSRSLPSSRGRGGSVADRGGRGGRGGGSTSAPRTSVPRGGGIPGRGGRGGQSNVKPQFASRSQTEAPQKPAESDITEETSDWKNGPMEFKRSEVAAAVPSSSCESAQPSGSSVSTTAAPISFAAVAAAAARREQERAMAPPRPVTPPVQEPFRAYSPVKDTPFEEPETSEPAHAEDIFVSEPSVANPLDEPEEEPIVEDELVNVVSDHNVQAASPQLQANAVWTTQLKSELGIGVPLSTDASPVKPQQQYTAPAPIAGVEFVTDAVSAVLPDYSFGFVDVPAAPVVVPAVPAPVEPISQQQESLFSTVRHSAAAVSPMKPSEIAHSNLTNGDYSLRSTSPPAVNPLSQTTARSLGFGDASTVSYTPSGGVERQMPGTKPLGHLPQPQQHQSQQSSQQQHQTQQSHQPQMFPPQLPYSSFPPYMGMYSPVTNVRPDDYAAALMGQYPFGGMNMDLTNFMANSGLAQTSSNQPLSSQHRSDSHGMDSMKFPSQNTRDQSQSSAVQPPPPPPGFGAGASQFLPSQPLNNLVMPHQYTPQHYSFYLPNVTNAGRQMYAQEDERSRHEKMGGGKPTPPPQFHHSNTSYLSGGAKKYNWNS